MSTSQTVDRNRSHRARGRKLLWPPAVAVFLFTVSYPANDFYGAKQPSDTGIGVFLVYAGIALATAGVVSALVLSWALRRERVPVGSPWHSRSRAGSLPDSPPVVRCSAGPGSTRRKAASSPKPPS
jgi:hypothetical protein